VKNEDCKKDWEKLKLKEGKPVLQEA